MSVKRPLLSNCWHVRAAMTECASSNCVFNSHKYEHEVLCHKITRTVLPDLLS